MTAGKLGIQHTDTMVANVGGGTAPASMVVVETDAGARTVDGSSLTIQNDASTARRCRIGDTVKYLNLFIEAAARSGEADADTEGWLEWALVCVKESETAVPITQMGVLTLSNICTNMFRNECIFTGVVPVGARQPIVQSIKLKIPNTKSQIRIGDEWRFITAFRPSVSTSVSTTAVRLIKSFMYKCYS